MYYETLHADSQALDGVADNNIHAQDVVADIPETTTAAGPTKFAFTVSPYSSDGDDKEEQPSGVIFSRRVKISNQKVTPTPETTLILDDECMRDRRWWVFLLSSLLTLVGLIFSVLIYRAIAFIVNTYTASSSSSSSSALSAAAAAAVGQHTDTCNGSVQQKHANIIQSQMQQQQQKGELRYRYSAATAAANKVEPPPPPPTHAQLAEQAHHKRYHQMDQQTQVGWVAEAKDWAGELISGQSATGRILVILVFLLSIASLIIYFVDASRIGPNNGQFSEGVEKCQKWSESLTQQIDLALNVFFMVYFFIRVSIYIFCM